MAGRRRGDGQQHCTACGMPLLVQWVGDVAALKARVTLPPHDQPHPYSEALQDRTPDDLIWCLPRLPHRALRLRWTNSRHPPDCPHQHLTSHKCPTQPLF